MPSHQNNALCYKSIKTTAKLHELGCELLSHSLYSPNLAPSDFFLVKDLERMFAGKQFSTNEEVIAKTEAYLGAYLSKSYYKWNTCTYLLTYVVLQPIFG
jgi:hypothetical protein